MPGTRKRIRLIIEHFEDGYIAYPLGLKGVVVAQGDTYEEALREGKSAVESHLEAFGPEELEEAEEAKEVFVAEVLITVPEAGVTAADTETTAA